MRNEAFVTHWSRWFSSQIWALCFSRCASPNSNETTFQWAQIFWKQYAMRPLFLNKKLDIETLQRIICSIIQADRLIRPTSICCPPDRWTYLPISLSLSCSLWLVLQPYPACFKSSAKFFWNKTKIVERACLKVHIAFCYTNESPTLLE